MKLQQIFVLTSMLCEGILIADQTKQCTPLQSDSDSSLAARASFAKPAEVMRAASQKAFSPIQLNPDIIGLIDGKSFAMSGEVIGASIKICRDIQAIQSGKLLTSGNREGRYTYKNKKHCIKTLLPIERELKEKLATLKSKQSTDDKIKNEIKIVENDLCELNKLLKQMHAEFKQLVDPLMGNAQNSKEPLTIIIEEECYARGRQDSLLLDWVKLDSDEWDSFGDKVTSFEVFDQFCTDLINFISDLVYNCKKGRAQFEKLLAQYTQQSQKPQS